MRICIVTGTSEMRAQRAWSFIRELGDSLNASSLCGYSHGPTPH